MTFILGSVLFLLGAFLGMLTSAFILAVTKQMELQKDSQALRKKLGI